MPDSFCFLTFSLHAIKWLKYACRIWLMNGNIVFRGQKRKSTQSSKFRIIETRTLISKLHTLLCTTNHRLPSWFKFDVLMLVDCTIGHFFWDLGTLQQRHLHSYSKNDNISKFRICSSITFKPHSASPGLFPVNEQLYALNTNSWSNHAHPKVPNIPKTLDINMSNKENLKSLKH